MIFFKLHDVLILYIFTFQHYDLWYILDKKITQHI